MDAGFLCQTRSPVPSLPRQKRACKLKHRSPVLAVLTRTPDHNMTGEEKKASRPTDKLAGLTKKTTVNNDSWFAKLAINYLSQRFQDATGMRNSKRDYESLTQTARDTWRKFSPTQQHELVLQSLNRAIPATISALVKIMLPQCTFTREYFAAFTTLFFVWLVGPCEKKKVAVEHPFPFLPPLASVPLPWEKNMPVAEESHQEIICHGSLKNRELSQKKRRSC
ncbi:beta-carotene isomerase D27 [Populus alba x Populus x berolinensis]|uniref:Beta-carotene isomerase D27 n=1 Tax=Populus alba x Populus x berolinensis TaxID=444605 RepID=A0AAD6RCD5_9ROSI|nr:beta-carotene isomerase D27 [Populus alba x Populus x berolinensis]